MDTTPGTRGTVALLLASLLNAAALPAGLGAPPSPYVGIHRDLRGHQPLSTPTEPAVHFSDTAQEGPLHGRGISDKLVNVILPSGATLPLSTHRRVLSRDSPLIVELPNGQRIYCADRAEFRAKMAAAQWTGAQVRFLSEEKLPITYVREILQNELGERVVVQTPDKVRVPYSVYNREHVPSVVYQPNWIHQLGVAPQYSPRFSSSTLYHRPESNNDSTVPGEHQKPEEDVPTDKLFVTLGCGQRLLFNVHDGIYNSFKARGPLDLLMPNGNQMYAEQTDEFLRGINDGDFAGSTVKVGSGIEVPVETYKAVVDAHKHGGVYVEFPNGKRVPFCEYDKGLKRCFSGTEPESARAAPADYPAPS